MPNVFDSARLASAALVRSAADQDFVAEESTQLLTGVSTVAATQSILGNTEVLSALTAPSTALQGFVFDTMSAAIAGVPAEPSNLLRQAAMRHAKGNGTTNDAVLSLCNSAGQPLPQAHRQRFEQTFGADFSEVRVHVDGTAQRAAEALNAHAFALGADLFFGAGEYAPGSADGDRLLAHELTHVVQHQEGRLPTGGGVSSPSDPAEMEAYANEAKIVSALPSVSEAVSMHQTQSVEAASSQSGQDGSTVHRDEAEGEVQGEGEEAGSTAEQVAKLLTYDAVENWAIEDEEAIEAFRLIAGAEDKEAIWNLLASEEITERLWDNLPGHELTYNLETTLAVFESLDDEAKLARMVDLLSYGLTDYEVDEREFTLVIQTLQTMTTEARKTFILADGGKWFARVVATEIPDELPDVQGAEDKTWFDLAVEAIDATNGFIDAVAADPQGALDTLKQGGQMAYEFITQGTIDLNEVQDLSGGDLGGVELDTDAQNVIDLDVNGETGNFDVNIDELGVTAIDAGGVLTDGGLITCLHGQLKWATEADGASGMTAEIGSLQFDNVDVLAETADPVFQVALSTLVLSALKLASEKAPGGDATPTSPEEAAVLLQTEIVEWVKGSATWLSKIGAEPNADADTITERIAENFGGSTDYEVSLGSASITDLVFMQANEEGELEEVASVGEVSVEGIVSTYEERETIALLTEEKERLLVDAETRTLGVEEQERLAWIDGELAELAMLADRAAELEPKVEDGSITQAEADELIECQNALTTRVVKVEAEVVVIKDAVYEGEGVEDATIEGAEATVAGDLVDDTDELTSEEQAAADAAQLDSDADELDSVIDNTVLSDAEAAENDAAREEAAEAEELAAAEAEGDTDLLENTTVDVHVDSASASGITTDDATVESASVDNLDVSASNDDVSASADHVEAEGVDAESSEAAVHVGDVSADGVDVAYDGNVVSAAAEHGEVNDVGYADAEKVVLVESASVDNADVRGVHDDEIGSATASHVEADGVVYAADGGYTDVSHLEADGVSATDVNTEDCTGTVAVDSAGATDITYIDDEGTDVTVGEVDAEGVSATVGEDSTTAHVDDASATDIAYQDGDGTKVTVGSADMDGLDVVAEDEGNTTASVDGASADVIHYEDGDGTTADIDQASIEESDVTANADKEVVEANVTGLQASNIHVVIHGSEEASKEKEPSPSEALDATALSGSNGTFYAEVPINVTWKGERKLGVQLTISGEVVDGVVDLTKLQVSQRFMINGILTAVLRSFLFEIVADSEGVAGITTKGKGGTVDIAEVAESLMNGAEAEAEVEEDGGRLSAEADVGATQFNLVASSGDGSLGTDSANVTLDDSANGANQIFVFSTGLGQQVEASSRHLSASAFHITDSDGGTVDAGQTGVDSMVITVDQPLQSNYTLDLHVDGLSISEIHYSAAAGEE
jgi:hypothetical protein